MRKDWKKLFSLEKTERHHNGLQVVFIERTVINYSLGTLRTKGIIAVKRNVIQTLKEEFLMIRIAKC